MRGGDVDWEDADEEIGCCAYRFEGEEKVDRCWATVGLQPIWPRSSSKSPAISSRYRFERNGSADESPGYPASGAGIASFGSI